MQLKKKSTGVVVDVLSPKILTPEEAVAKGVTASFVECRTDDGTVLVVFGYKDDGTPSDKNEYELVEEQPKQEGITTDGPTEETTIH